jgi:hypothetical protein
VRRRQVVLGGVFVISGAAIAAGLLLVKGVPDPGSDSYSRGQFIGFAVAVLMVLVGTRALIKNSIARRRAWIAAGLLLCVGVAAVLGGSRLWDYLRVDRANALAVKYGAASTKDDATLAERCTGVMREDYNTTDDPGVAGVPPKAFALLAPKVCELGVERGLVHTDGTMSEKAGYDLTLEVIQRMGAGRVQMLVANELAVAQYHLAKPGEVTSWHRCVALGYAGWDAQSSKEHLPPRDLFRRAVREACSRGIESGLIPASGAPEPDSPAFAEFQRLVALTLLELSGS